MKNTHTEQTGLPLKRLGQLTLVSIPGLSRITEEELKDRVRVSETYLPAWAEAGIRNRMIMNGYCAGFVTPEKPLNPLADDEITQEMKDGSKPEDAVHVMGSYFWMKLVEMTPVISKDELQALSYKLICKARSVEPDSKLEDNLPVAVSVQALAECKRIASERLVKKAGVKISFYDIILDPANELLICNTSSAVSLNRLLDKMRYVLAGRFSGDGMSADDQDSTRETFELTHVLQGGVDTGAVQEAVTATVMEKDLKEYSKSDNVWADLGLPVMEWPKNLPQLFNVAIAGMVLSQVFDEELNNSIEAAYAIVDNPKNKDKCKELTKLLDMYELAEAAVNSMETIPVLKSISVGESKGVGMTYPFGDHIQGLLHDSNRKILFDAVMHNVRFKTFEKFETVDSIMKSTMKIKAVEGEIVIGQYDVTVKFHDKGQTIIRVSPGTNEHEIIPLKPGINMSDIADRIENSVMICQKLNETFVELYRRMSELYILASGINLITGSWKGSK